MNETLQKLTGNAEISVLAPSAMRELLMQHSLNSPLCNSVRRLKFRDGLSDLDCMTILAFNAILSLEAVQADYLSYRQRGVTVTLRMNAVEEVSHD